MGRESNYFNVMGKFAFPYRFPIFSERIEILFILLLIARSMHDVVCESVSHFLI